MEKEIKKILITSIILSVVISTVVGGAVGFWAGSAVNSKGFLGVISQALTGKDNTKDDLELCQLVKKCEQPVATSTPGQVSSLIASSTSSGQAVKPWLGVNYIQITPAIAEVRKLDANSGVLVISGDGINAPAVLSDSPAARAGIVENDIILSLNSQKIDGNHPLSSLISAHQPGDTIVLTILHSDRQKFIRVKLGEAK